MTHTALNSRVLQTLHQNSKDMSFHPGNNHWSPHFSEPQFPQVQRKTVKFIRSLKSQQTLSLLLFSFLPIGGKKESCKKLNSWTQWFPKYGPWTSSSHSSTQKLLKMHIIRPPSRPTESELEVRPGSPCFNNPPSDSNACSHLRATHCVNGTAKSKWLSWDVNPGLGLLNSCPVDLGKGTW